MQIRRYVISIFVSVVALQFCNISPAIAATPVEQYRTILDEYKKASEEFNSAYKAAANEEERRAISEKLGRKATPNAFALQLLELMRANPDHPIVFDAFAWINARIPGSPETDEVVTIVLANWLDKEELKKACKSLTYTCGRPGQRLLSKAILKSPHRSVQGFARYASAMSKVQDLDRASNSDSQERDRVEAQLEEIIANYGDLEWGDATLGQEAEMRLAKSRKFRIGQPVPEIDGIALDGEPMKLSNFRGKVVLVVFWATWCGPCMASVPEEHAMVEKLAGKPFVLIGVNGDEGRENAFKVGTEKGVNWRSFYNGGDHGPITDEWNVSVWPSLFLIDADGRLSAKGDILSSISVRTGKDGKLEQYRLVDDMVEKLVKQTMEKK